MINLKYTNDKIKRKFEISNLRNNYRSENRDLPKFYKFSFIPLIYLQMQRGENEYRIKMKILKIIIRIAMKVYGR